MQLLNYTEPHQIYMGSGEVILLVIHMTKGWDKNSYLIQKSGNAIPFYILSPNPHSSSSLGHCWTSPAPPRALLGTFLSPCHASSHHHQLLPLFPFTMPPPNAERNFAAIPSLTVRPLRNPREKWNWASGGQTFQPKQVALELWCLRYPGIQVQFASQPQVAWLDKNLNISLA